MKTSAKLLLALGACALSFAASAQTLLVGAEATKKLPHNFSVGIDAEYRSMEWFDHTAQWSVGANIGYKPAKFLKLGLKYEYLRDQELGETKNEQGVDYVRENYWNNKHRASISVTGDIKIWKFELSLRERFQYTYRPYQEIDQFEYDPFDNSFIPDGNKKVNAKSKIVLRSRLQVEFKPYKKCPWKPYASFELYSLLADINHTKAKTDPALFCDKFRITAGTSYKINKKNDIDFFYRYANTADDDEREMKHTIGIVYKFDF